MNDGILFVVSAPSGAGKTTLCSMAVEYFASLYHSISFTTRPPREGETDGLDYCFVDQETFEEMEAAGEFVESANVHGNKYGTSASDLLNLIRAGNDVMVEIDVQGAAQLKEKFSEAVRIFILPPSIEVCMERLSARGKDSAEEIAERVLEAKREIAEAPNYDYRIINEDLEKAFEEFKGIIETEKAKKSG